MKIIKEKKIIALIIVFTIILQTMLPIAMAVEDLNNAEKIEEIVGNSYGDFEYTIDDEKVTITGYFSSGEEENQNVIIPDEIEGYPVTTIGEGAFRGSSHIGNIKIPASVTEICDSAFRNCNGLTSIDIPDNVEIIGNGAFYECYNLKSIKLPNKLKKIKPNAFNHCYELDDVVIPANVEYIGYGSFWRLYGIINCKNIKQKIL